jgi:hypothetical protein
MSIPVLPPDVHKIATIKINSTYDSTLKTTKYWLKFSEKDKGLLATTPSILVQPGNVRTFYVEKLNKNNQLELVPYRCYIKNISKDKDVPFISYVVIDSSRGYKLTYEKEYIPNEIIPDKFKYLSFVDRGLASSTDTDSRVRDEIIKLNAGTITLNGMGFRSPPENSGTSGGTRYRSLKRRRTKRNRLQKRKFV